ncbi:MAG: hypothetical protein KatS3mg115_2050 [Candidatus Poribacteria bacterium]|nr:MAG: hypothetical protein KatS3mg115_2050 [Candidatus Poribacteria bacterium]
MRRWLLLVAIVSSSLTAWSQSIHYEQNFDGLNEGELAGQDGWEIGPPANMPSPIVTPQVKRGPTGKSLEISASQEAIRTFDPKITAGVHFLSIWFRFENPGVGDNTLHVYMGDEVREWQAGPVIRIGAQSGDPFKVGVHDGNTVVPLGEIRQGEWQHLLEVIDVDNLRYSVYLDDELIAEDFSWRNPANHQALGWLMLGFDLGSGLIGYFDDVVFGEGDSPPALSIQPEGKLATTWGELKANR